MVIAQYPPVVGGTERACHRLGRALAHLGVDVQVVTRRPLDAAAHEVRDGVEIHRLAVPRSHVMGALSFIARACRWLVDHPHDVVHCHQALSPATIGALAHRYTGCPVLVKLAGPGPIGDVAQLRNGPLSFVRRIILTGAVSGYACSSDELAGEIRDWLGPVRIWKVPNGIDVGSYVPQPPEARETMRRQIGIRGFAVLFTGSLRPEKNLPVLVSAMSRLPQDVELWITGDGGERDKIEATMRSLNLGARVHMAGEAPDVRPFLGAADAFVLPSVSEGMSNSLLEAMAAGIPIVASRIPGNQAVIEDGREGLLFDPRDASDLSRALLRLHGSPELGRELAAAARDRAVRDYDLPGVARRYLDVYHELAGR
jgi:glycosyltransferase involved in cell wall biosynthesis